MLVLRKFRAWITERVLNENFMSHAREVTTADTRYCDQLYCTSSIPTMIEGLK